MAKRTRLTATQKLRKLVQQQVRRMEQRGYRVDTSLKEKIKTGKYQTLKSIQKNKYKKLYESSSSEIEGKIVTGEQKRSYERSESAKRAAETRRSRRAQQEDYSGYDETEWTDEDEQWFRDWQRRQQEREADEEQRKAEEEWERKRRERDEKERRLAYLYEEGKIAYDNIYSLMNNYPGPGAKILSEALKSEIAQYGEEKVIQAMGTAPRSFVETAQMIIYYEDEPSAIHRALVNFIEVITGVIVNGELAKDIGDAMDEMTDMGSL